MKILYMWRIKFGNEYRDSCKDLDSEMHLEFMLF